VPTGTCKFPAHHAGPSAGRPIGLLALIVAGAVVIAHWRSVVVVLVVTAILAAATALVVMLVHRRHEGDAEHRAWELDRQAAAGRQITRPQPPAVHNHVHLHGTAAAGERPADPQPLPAVAALWSLPEGQMQAILDRAGISAELLAARIAGGAIRAAIEDER